MSGLSEQQLAEIRARESAATKGPWGTYDDGTGRIDIAAELEGTGHGYTCRRGIAQTDDQPIDNDPEHIDWDEADDQAQIEADAQFIAAARTDVPALLAEVDRLRGERDAFADRVDTLTAVAKGNKRHVASLLTSLTAIEKQARESDNDLTGAHLSLWEEEQETARLRLALASAQRGRRKQRARVAALETERHTTNEALDSSMQAIRAAHAAALAEAADEFEKRTAPTGERLVGKAAVLRFLRDRAAALTGGAQ